MEDKIKDIISVFIKVPSDQIGPATAIGRTVVKNSILLHRMYARLQEEGIVVDNYSQIQTFSDLLGRAGANGNGRAPGEEAGGLYEAAPAAVQVVGTRQGGASIGVDIEEIAAFPVTHDFRKEEFYKMNFSPSEIAYCI
ncbi:MAG TPA: 4'-phosphopantetheinyl transferase superfamily protein, partial [Puia sp.]|nr:4'-phosphopantetheinyl transferase superfamily protein [Puia sp.]